MQQINNLKYSSTASAPVIYGTLFLEQNEFFQFWWGRFVLRVPVTSTSELGLVVHMSLSKSTNFAYMVML